MASSKKRSEPSAKPEILIARTVDRFHQLFDSYDNVWVSWSGGKDSTCILECGAIAARERGTRLVVNFYDEEVIPAGTVDFAMRMRERDDLDFRWHCIPIVDNNAWEPDNPYWYPWEPESEPLWARPRPEFAITSVPGYDPDQKRYSLEFLDHHIARALLPRTLVSCIGRRMAESPVAGIDWAVGWAGCSRRFMGGVSPPSPVRSWTGITWMCGTSSWKWVGIGTGPICGCGSPGSYGQGCGLDHCLVRSRPAMPT